MVIWAIADIKKDVEVLKAQTMAQHERDERQDKTAAEAYALLRQFNWRRLTPSWTACLSGHASDHLPAVLRASSCTTRTQPLTAWSTPTNCWTASTT
jgi:hypothetical protein